MRLTASHDLSEVVLDNGFLVVVRSNPSVVVPKAVNKVLPSSMVYAQVEETSIGITVFQARNS